MNSRPVYDPAVMTSWHVQKLDQLFPETIRNGFWRPTTEKLSRKLRESLGISTQPKYKRQDEEQSINLFSESAKHRDTFIALQRQFHATKHPVNVEQQLRNQIRDEAVSALQGFYDSGSIHVKKFYDRNLSIQERMSAYRRWTRTLDHCMDIYSKLAPITGDNFEQLIKNCEDAQVEIRADAINELAMSDPEVLDVTDKVSRGILGPTSLDFVTASARVRYTAEIMLHSIKTINPKRLDPSAVENRVIEGRILPETESSGGTIEIGNLKKYSANNTSYNCTRVVPATIGVVFGAKLKAVAAIDDNQQDRSIRSQWKTSYEHIYGSRFTPVNNLEEMFNALQQSPPGTTGIIYNQWRGTPDAHVSVVANIAGVPCMVEGQTGEMIVRNPSTGKFETHSLGQNGVQIRPYDQSSLTNIQVMIVSPERNLTEHQRAKIVIEKLHEPFFEKDIDTIERPSANRRQYYVDAHSGGNENLKRTDNMISPPPGPIPSRDPFTPGPPIIGPPPPRR